MKNDENMDYIRKYYNVPAKYGMNVIANGKKGVIVGSYNSYLRIRLENKFVGLFHPTWNIKYLGS